MNFIYKAKDYAQKTAIVSGGNEYTYQTLFDEATLFAKILLGGEQDLDEQRVAFMEILVLIMLRCNGPYGLPVALPFRFVCLIQFLLCNM